MSLSILFGLKKTGGASIGEIELDATLTETHDRASTVTAYPVEDGADVTDHIDTQPKRVRVEGFVSGNPLRILGAGLGWGQGQRRVADAFEALEELHKSKELVTIVTGLSTYTDMALMNLNIPRDRNTGQSLRFSADFVEVRLVASQSVDIPADRLASDVKDLASPRQDMGTQRTTQPSPKEKEAVTYLGSITGVAG